MTIWVFSPPSKIWSIPASPLAPQSISYFSNPSAPKPRVSEATIYNWKAKYGGLEVSEAKRLRSLEDENAKLKRLLADAMLDNAALKDLLTKKW